MYPRCHIADLRGARFMVNSTQPARGDAAIHLDDNGFLRPSRPYDRSFGDVRTRGSDRNAAIVMIKKVHSM